MSTETEGTVLQAAISDLNIADAGSNGLKAPKQRSTGSRTKARDITSHFTKAASRLATGELVKDDLFTLFEAVGALEIMDAKMDSGFLGPSETLEDDYDISASLTPEQVIGVMDAMLCSEVAWHMGHPLSQTLFTSLYIDRLLWPEPKSIEQATFDRGRAACNESIGMLDLVLRAYCLLLIKTCDFVHRRITCEGYYEEEDFVTNLYHRSLLTDFDKEAILEISQRAIDYVARFQSIKDSVRNALICRLRFRQTLLEATSVAPGDFKSQGPKAWSDCLSHIGPIHMSHELGTPVPHSFSVKVQRRLTSSVPPRPIVNVGFDTSYKFLKRLCADAVASVGILRCPRASNVITFLRVFLSGKPQSSLYVRCLLQSLVFESTRREGKDMERELIINELEELVLPYHDLSNRSNAEIELPRDSRFQIWMKMSQCASQIFDAYHDLLRALCMNRPRSRRMLCHLILDWDNLQLDLEDLDTELREYTNEKPIFAGMEAWELPLSSFAYFHKLRQMEWIVQLGFELNIYHADERAGMYQYLYGLADVRQKHINRIHGFVHHHYYETGTRKPAGATAAFEHTLSVLAYLAEEASATAQLAQAFASLYQALAFLDLIPKWPPRPYSTDEFRRALRLRPFLQICLPQLGNPSEPFDQIECLANSLQQPSIAKVVRSAASRNQNIVKAVALLDHADELGRAARKGLDLISKAEPEAAMCVGCEEDWRKGIKESTRSAVVAGVLGARVKKWACTGPEQGDLKLKFTENDIDEAPGNMAACWVVPSILSTR